MGMKGYSPKTERQSTAAWWLGMVRQESETWCPRHGWTKKCNFYCRNDSAKVRNG